MSKIFYTFASFFFNNALPAILILLIGFFLSNKLVVIIKKAMNKSHVDESFISFSNSVLKVIFKSIVILMAIAFLGVNISSIITALSAALVTVGLALKDNLSNAASGVIIIINKPFKIGDFLETNSINGKVTKIEMLTTTLVTSDNKEIIVPNSKLTVDYIINSSVHNQRRLDLNLPIKKETSFLDVQPLIFNLIKNNANILLEPVPVVSISGFNNDTVNVKIKVWCYSENYNLVEKYLYENIKLELDKNNITF